MSVTKGKFLFPNLDHLKQSATIYYYVSSSVSFGFENNL